MATPAKKPVRKPVVRKRPVKAVAQDAAPHAAAKQKHVGQRSYIFAVGRRKEAVARVRWTKGGTGDITINGRTLEAYFPTRELQQLVRSPLTVSEMMASTISAKVAGGGTQGQAEAVRLGVARALVHHDADLRLVLKRAGFMRRDPRVKERKKYGLKRARRAPQWQKR